MKTLNDREIELLGYIAMGYTAKEIAKHFGLEYRTVENYLARIRKKLCAKNMAHATCIAMHSSLLRLESAYLYSIPFSNKPEYDISHLNKGGNNEQRKNHGF